MVKCKRRCHRRAELALDLIGGGGPGTSWNVLDSRLRGNDIVRPVIQLAIQLSMMQRSEDRPSHTPSCFWPTPAALRLTDSQRRTMECLCHCEERSDEAISNADRRGTCEMRYWDVSMASVTRRGRPRCVCGNACRRSSCDPCGSGRRGSPGAARRHVPSAARR